MDQVREPEQLVVASEALIKNVLDAAFYVHTEFGPGLLESVYEAALVVELEERGIASKSQVSIPVAYRGRDLGVAFRADLIVEEQLLVELKAVDQLADIHLAQTMTYLRAGSHEAWTVAELQCGPTQGWSETSINLNDSWARTHSSLVYFVP